MRLSCLDSLGPRGWGEISVLTIDLKDYELARLLSALGDDTTVLLFSDPNDSQAYEPSFVEPMRTDLKRRADGGAVYVGRRAGNATDHRGLFEKYQFFTPGMCLSLLTLWYLPLRRVFSC